MLRWREECQPLRNKLIVVVEAHPLKRESIAVLEMISCDFYRYWNLLSTYICLRRFPFLVGFCSCNEKWQQGFLKPKFPTNNRMKTYSSKKHHEILCWVKNIFFFPGTLGCVFYEIAIKGKWRNICYFSVFTVQQRAAPYQNQIPL